MFPIQNKLLKAIYFVFIIFLISCQKNEIVKIEQAKYEKYAFRHDEQFAYFMGIDEFSDYRKKIEYSIHGHPINIFQYATPAMDTLHGAWAGYYETGKLRASGYYKNGKKYGPWKKYFNAKLKGQAFLESTEYYINNKLHGQMEIYHENGNLFTNYNYKNGNKMGVVQKFMPDKTKIYEAKYDANEILIYQTEWYPNARKKLHEEYKQGDLILKQSFDTKEVLRLEVSKNENNSFTKRQFDENGVEISTEQWTN